MECFRVSAYLEAFTTVGVDINSKLRVYRGQGTSPTFHIKSANEFKVSSPPAPRTASPYWIWKFGSVQGTAAHTAPYS